jgi:hypothetical protein
MIMKKFLLMATMAVFVSGFVLANDGNKGKDKGKKTTAKHCGKECSKNKSKDKS